MLTPITSKKMANQQLRPVAPLPSGKRTNPGNKNVYLVLLLVFLGLVFGMWIVSQQGLAVGSYEEAVHYTKIAGILMWPMAIVSGFALAYKATHPKILRYRSDLHQTALVIFAFLFGALPGLIIALVITYPLSQHACQLSGSKYC
jgi:DMSO/TMAO reductase YedYZ heme-binding membrane subunit